jgi:hypothetical protein
MIVYASILAAGAYATSIPATVPAPAGRVYGTHSNSAVSLVYTAKPPSVMMKTVSLSRYAATVDMPRNQPLSYNYPQWLPGWAAASATLSVAGLIASIAMPGPVTGLMFPLGLGGIWFSSKLIRER